MQQQHPWEKRLYTRSEHSVPVSVYYNDQYIGTRNTKNASFGGMLIETRDLGLSAYSLISLAIETSTEYRSTSARIPALVKRINETGIAVMFESLDSANKALLTQFLHTQA